MLHIQNMNDNIDMNFIVTKDMKLSELINMIHKHCNLDFIGKEINEIYWDDWYWRHNDNLNDISLGSIGLLELNLMKKAWRPYGVDVTLKAHSLKRILEKGTSNGDINREVRRNSKKV